MTVDEFALMRASHKNLFVDFYTTWCEPCKMLDVILDDVKQNLTEKISKFISENSITAVWLMTFTYILPQVLLNVLPGGFINFHYGLLPKYRGANPILSQMLNYEVEGGITIHLVDSGIDTGPIVMQQKIPIEDTDTFGIQIQKLASLGASLVPRLLQFYELSSRLPSQPQDENQAQYFKKPFAGDLMIKWQTMSAIQVIRLVNACNPWNKGAGAVINSQVICITDAELAVDLAVTVMMPGIVVLLDDKNGLIISSSDNKLIRVNICYTPEGFFTGKKLNRFGIKINDKFTS